MRDFVAQICCLLFSVLCLTLVVFLLWISVEQIQSHNSHRQNSLDTLSSFEGWSTQKYTSQKNDSVQQPNWPDFRSGQNKTDTNR